MQHFCYHPELSMGQVIYFSSQGFWKPYFPQYSKSHIFFLDFLEPYFPKNSKIDFSQIFRNPTSPKIQSPKFFLQDFEFWQNCFLLLG